MIKIKDPVTGVSWNACYATVEDVIVHGLTLGYVFMSPFCVCTMHASFKLACTATLCKGPRHLHYFSVTTTFMSAQCPMISTLTGVNLLTLTTKV